MHTHFCSKSDDQVASLQHSYSTACVGLYLLTLLHFCCTDTVLSCLVVVVQQILRMLLLLRNIQLTEENSLLGISMTPIVCKPDFKLFFWLPFY